MTNKEARAELERFFSIYVTQPFPEFMNKAIEALRNENDLRNELCLMCGKYVNAHKGACKDCRWEDRNE